MTTIASAFGALRPPVTIVAVPPLAAGDHFASSVAALSKSSQTKVAESTQLEGPSPTGASVPPLPSPLPPLSFSG